MVQKGTSFRFGRARVRRRVSRGFTLMELMIVVVIMGVLASLAVYGVRSYIQRAKTVEAREVIASIKGGQEAFYDETFRFLNVSPSIDDYYPVAAPNGAQKVQWGAAGCANCLQNFNTLGVSVAQPVSFGYASTAGTAGGALDAGAGVTATAFNAGGVAPTAPFYVVKAVSDLDNDGGGRSIYVSTNFQGGIYEEETPPNVPGE